VKDNKLAFRDWGYKYGRHSGGFLTIQYRFGNGLMKSVQGRDGNPVFIDSP